MAMIAKTADEMQFAHDLLTAALEELQPSDRDVVVATKVARATLCWALGHDDHQGPGEPSVTKVLASIERALDALGYKMVRMH